MRINPILIDSPASENVYQTGIEVMIKSLPFLINKDKPISNEKLKTLVQNWSKGIHYKEATNQLVDAVACSFKERLGEKNYQNMVDQITNFLVDDQQFIKDLTKNLSLIGKV